MGLEMGINLGAATEEEGWSGGVHVTLECPRDAAWKLFSDFGGLCKWKPAITVCDLVEGKDNEVGSVRYCRGTLPDSWVHEWLLVHDNENYLLKYRMEGNRFRFPEGVQGYVSQIQFHAAGKGKTSVDWTYSVQPVATQTYEQFPNFMTAYGKGSDSPVDGVFDGELMLAQLPSFELHDP
nr:lachrymatory-factor synthase-like [Physcomitrium patens]|eukprot:XP_024374012.1 lachrymatory-factor synthase-like [Physcomitrella patens]